MGKYTILNYMTMDTRIENSPSLNPPACDIRKAQKPFYEFEGVNGFDLLQGKKMELSTFKSDGISLKSREDPRLTLDLAIRNEQVTGIRFRRRKEYEYGFRESSLVVIPTGESTAKRIHIVHTYNAPPSAPEYAHIPNPPFDNTDIAFTLGENRAEYSSTGSARFSIEEKYEEYERDDQGDLLQDEDGNLIMGAHFPSFAIEKLPSGKLRFPDGTRSTRKDGKVLYAPYGYDRGVLARVLPENSSIVVITENVKRNHETYYRAPMAIVPEQWKDLVNSPDWAALADKFPLHFDPLFFSNE